MSERTAKRDARSGAMTAAAEHFGNRPNVEIATAAEADFRDVAIEFDKHDRDFCAGDGK